MSLSYWEQKTWFSNTQFTIVGSGIVGLSCALRLRERFPQARILVLEKGTLPEGASTKNAGFACFGSISELLADLQQHSKEAVSKLVQKRWEGILRLRALLGDATIDYQNHGGHEVFLSEQGDLYEYCLENLQSVNQMLLPVFGRAPFTKQANTFGFKGVKNNYITHDFESQLDTGKMMQALIGRALQAGITILNGVEVEKFETTTTEVRLFTGAFEFQTQQLLIATNGFANQLLEEQVRPARAQVLITEPIENLGIKGTFHLEEGYYYFRNIDNRILLGGGRNLDLEGESTIKLGQTPLIQDRLEQLLREVILPGTNVGIDRRWSGIMGVGTAKHPIVKQLQDRIYCGVRLGGMGVAIGSLVGAELADLLPEV